MARALLRGVRILVSDLEVTVCWPCNYCVVRGQCRLPVAHGRTAEFASQSISTKPADAPLHRTLQRATNSKR